MRRTNLKKHFTFRHISYSILLLFNSLLCIDLHAQGVNQIDKITALDRQLSDEFGSSVAIDGNFAIVGTCRHSLDSTSTNNLNKAGAAYIYEKGSNGWHQTAKLVPADRAENDQFGYAVSISGDYAVVGAIYEDEDASGMNSLSNAGSAYIFKRGMDGGWHQKAKLVATDRGANDEFGYSVSIHGDYVAVGAKLEDEDSIGFFTLESAGSVYIFEQAADGQWHQNAKLVAADRGSNDEFGYSVSIHGDYVAIGARFEDEDSTGSNTLESADSAYIFKRKTNGGWQQKAKLLAEVRGAGDQFGSAISISGNYVAVGAYLEDEDSADNNTLANAGSAYIFKRANDEGW